jgi:hypothetical protein
MEKCFYRYGSGKFLISSCQDVVDLVSRLEKRGTALRACFGFSPLGEASFTEWSVLSAYGKFEHVLRGEPTFEAGVLGRNP